MLELACFVIVLFVCVCVWGDGFRCVCAHVCHGRRGQRTTSGNRFACCRFQEVASHAWSGYFSLPSRAFVVFCFFNECLLLLSKQTATDSSSNSSQKREPTTRTISSPTSCEHRKIYTLDPYPMDHYHPDQVSRARHPSGNISIALGWTSLPSPQPKLLLPTHFPIPLGGSAAGGGSLASHNTLPHPVCALSGLIQITPQGQGMSTRSLSMGT